LIWDNRADIAVDFATMQAEQIPHCVRCGGVARPNILMFGDVSWLSERTRQQERAFDEFLTDHRHARLVVLEMGAGTAIPTIRYLGERLTANGKGMLIRINPREAQTPAGAIAISAGALAALKLIDAHLQSAG
jgi:NAD-dependent SIR2 family protein deacetylase